MNEVIKLIDKASTIKAIKSLCEEDLIYLNRLIVDRIKLMRHAENKNHLRQFNLGARVRFRTQYGEEKTGTVIRINQKTISVSSGENGGWWNLSPELLTLEKEAHDTLRNQ